MVEFETMLQIKILSEQGKSIRSIARILGVSRNTVKRYLLKDANEPSQYKARPCVVGKLKAYQDYLRQRQQAAAPEWIAATVLYREIGDQGYTGSLSLLRQFLRTLKPSTWNTHKDHNDDNCFSSIAFAPENFYESNYKFIH